MRVELSRIYKSSNLSYERDANELSHPCTTAGHSEKMAICEIIPLLAEVSLCSIKTFP